MTGTLDKIYEETALAANTTKEKDYAIPDGEIWIIASFGSGSDIDGVVATLQYSEDNGTTFINPLDDDVDFIRKLHVTAGPQSGVNMQGIEFTGGTNRILRMVLQNNNSVNVASTSCWINGTRRK